MKAMIIVGVSAGIAIAIILSLGRKSTQMGWAILLYGLTGGVLGAMIGWLVQILPP